VTIKATGSGTVYIEAPSPSSVQPGKNMTIFVNVTSGSQWGYLQAFAQDGPAKGYRWSSSGYNSYQVLQGEWNSIVVPIPSDYSGSGGTVGLAIGVNAADTITLYADAIFFRS
jgi:hypothetical protein